MSEQPFTVGERVRYSDDALRKVGICLQQKDKQAPRPLYNRTADSRGTVVGYAERGAVPGLAAAVLPVVKWDDGSEGMIHQDWIAPASEQ